MIKITHVAIKHKGRVHSLPAPNRHHHVIHRIRPTGKVEEGFMDDHGNFISRKLAFILAKANGQLNRKPGAEHYQGDELFSEDIW